MDKRILSVFVLICYAVMVCAQPDSHLLPVAHITTVDGVMPTCDHLPAPEGLMGVATINNDYVQGKIVIVEGDSTLFDSGEYAEDENGKRVSGMRIRIRGNTSSKSSFPPYKVNLSVAADPLGMGSVAKNWHLLRPFPLAKGNTIFNNLIGRHVALMTGVDWQPDYRFVEVYMNGDYRGLYMMSETVERADDRVNVSKSGFIAECDAYWWTAEEGHWFRSPHQNSRVAYTFKFPEDEDFDNDDFLLPIISDRFAVMEDSLYNGKKIDNLISIRTFAAWHLAKDYLGDIDAGGSNMYLFKKNMKPTSKLKAGPLWDFDNCFRIDDRWHAHHSLDWMYGKQLYKREEFVLKYLDKYEATNPVMLDEVINLVDSVQAYYGDNLDLAIARSNKRCGTSFPSVDEHRDFLVEYFQNRLSWLQYNMEEFYGMVLEVKTTDAKQPVRIYDLRGVLLRTVDDFDDIEETGLPEGVYVVKNNNVARKVHVR